MSEWSSEGPRTHVRVSRDGWVADVWRPASTMMWRFSITTPGGTTTVSAVRYLNPSTAKSKAWRWLEAERAKTRNRAALTTPA